MILGRFSPIKCFALSAILFLAQGCGSSKSDGQAERIPYEVSFDLEGDVAVGAIEFSIDYDSSVGQFQGNAGRVECTSRVGDMGAYNHQRAEHNVLASLIGIDGIAGGATVVTCDFDQTGSSAPRGTDFEATVTRAVSPAGDPILILPAITVSSVFRS